MPKTSLEENILQLVGMGYDGIEICVSPRHLDAMPAEDQHSGTW